MCVCVKGVDVGVKEVWDQSYGVGGSLVLEPFFLSRLGVTRLSDPPVPLFVLQS